MTKRTNFYCNPKALNSLERSQHKQLTDKLLASKTAVREARSGYEFQFSPSAVSIQELAQWVSNESKCCPFLDFHIDLEREGDLLCLRLTGAAGIKEFMRAEFQIASSSNSH